ncbi:hypothetical protein [Streptomyces sp. NPDC059575]|uniref:hypothetical protein n=1 Tax=Streptomyces sp. NPDC059575 TaxID=3346872 RepID=UPI0036ACE587
MNPERPQNPDTPEDVPVPEPEQTETGRPATAEMRGGAAAGSGATDAGAHTGAVAEPGSADTDAAAESGAADAGAPTDVKPETAGTDVAAEPETAAKQEAASAGAGSEPGSANADADADTAADAKPEAAATGVTAADTDAVAESGSADAGGEPKSEAAGTGVAAEPEGLGTDAEPECLRTDAEPEAAHRADARATETPARESDRATQTAEPESPRAAEAPTPEETSRAGASGPEGSAPDAEAPSTEQFAPATTTPSPEEPVPGATAAHPTPAPDAPTPTKSTHSAAPHSDEPAPPPRPRTALIVASVAAAVLALGGGGAWLASGLGADGGAGTPGAGGTPPPLALDGWSPAGASSAAGIAPGEPNPYGVRYVAGGKLPDGPESAPVHVTEGTVGEDAVVRLARALEVDGAPVADGDGWRVGGRAGEPVLRVAGGAAGGWSFSRYTPGTDNCPKADVCAQDPVAPAADAVSVAKARQVVAPVLKALGQDAAKTDASQVMGARRVVNADPVVGGLPTYGWTTGLTVDERGEIVGGHGMLAVPEKGAEYPVLGAAKTLELLNSAQPGGHRMGIGGCATPEPLKDRLEQPCGSDVSPGSPEGDRLTVQKAVFGLAVHPVGGRETLVPSWLYEVRGAAARGTFTVTYPAVDPKYLAAPSPLASLSASSPVSGARSVKVGAYSADGRELTVRFMGGVCADHRAAARESAGRVTVSVTEHPRPGKVCVLMAKEFAETVRLDAPLGGRTVVTEDGGRVPRAESLGRPAK